jgi:hypothetical protein
VTSVVVTGGVCWSPVSRQSDAAFTSCSLDDGICGLAKSCVSFSLSIASVLEVAADCTERDKFPAPQAVSFLGHHAVGPLALYIQLEKYENIPLSKCERTGELTGKQPTPNFKTAHRAARSLLSKGDELSDTCTTGLGRTIWTSSTQAETKSRESLQNVSKRGSRDEVAGGKIREQTENEAHNDQAQTMMQRRYQEEHTIAEEWALRDRQPLGAGGWKVSVDQQ